MNQLSLKAMRDANQASCESNCAEGDREKEGKRSRPEGYFNFSVRKFTGVGKKTALVKQRELRC